MFIYLLLLYFIFEMRVQRSQFLHRLQNFLGKNMQKHAKNVFISAFLKEYPVRKWKKDAFFLPFADKSVSLQRQSTRSNSKTTRAMKVCIIGGGLGGLFTGAILTHEGCEVTVLEKNVTIGGGLQTFRRFGETFDTGMHVIGGMRPGGNIWRLCQYLGIIGRVRIRDVDDDCTDRIFFAEDRKSYTMAQGRERFVETLARQFPHEREGLRRYTEAVLHIADSTALFNLRPSAGGPSLFASAPEFLMAASDFIDHYVSDPRLRALLAYMNPLYGGRCGETPAYVHAIISTLYIEGASRFVGGSSHFADLLAGVITGGGGSVLTGDGVEWVEVSHSPSAMEGGGRRGGGRHVEYVRTRKGQVFTADRYISAIHPCTLLKLMDERAFPKAFRERLNSIPNAHSAFSLFIKLREGTFPYINHSEYYMTRYADVWNFSRNDRPWPLGFLFMTPPEEAVGGSYANKVLVTAPMSFEMVRKWENTTVGHRGADYEAWKEQQAAALLLQVEDLHPGFGQCIEAVNTASPLTIRDYYGAKEGTICGFSKDCRNIALSHLPVVTKADNLLLTGQNNNLHGFCGVPLTAITTAEAILGANSVLNKIQGQRAF